MMLWYWTLPRNHHKWCKWLINLTSLFFSLFFTMGCAYRDHQDSLNICDTVSVQFLGLVSVNSSYSIICSLFPGSGSWLVTSALVCTKSRIFPAKHKPWKDMQSNAFLFFLEGGSVSGKVPIEQLWTVHLMELRHFLPYKCQTGKVISKKEKMSNKNDTL